MPICASCMYTHGFGTYTDRGKDTRILFWDISFCHHPPDSLLRILSLFV